MHALGEQTLRRDEEENPYRHINIEDPVPAQILRNDTADGRASADPQRHHDAVHPQRLSSLMGRKDARDHGDIDGKDEGRAQSLKQTGRNQHHQGGCRTTDR